MGSPADESVQGCRASTVEAVGEPAGPLGPSGISFVTDLLIITVLKNTVASKLMYKKLNKKYG